MDQLQSRGYFYWARCMELMGKSSEIRHELLTACVTPTVSDVYTFFLYVYAALDVHIFGDGYVCWCFCWTRCMELIGKPSEMRHELLTACAPPPFPPYYTYMRYWVYVYAVPGVRIFGVGYVYWYLVRGEELAHHPPPNSKLETRNANHHLPHKRKRHTTLCDWSVSRRPVRRSSWPHVDCAGVP